MHITALYAFSEIRGKALQVCFEENNLNAEVFYLGTNLKSSRSVDADLFLADDISQLANLDEIISGKPRILLWEGTEEIYNNINFSFDRIFVAPFNFEDISLVVRNLIFMRQDYFKNNSLIVSDLVLNLRSREVKFQGAVLALSQKEFSLLEFLVRNQNRALTRNQILDSVWDQNQNIFTNTIDVHIAKLRKKLDSRSPDRFIKTLHGFGYIFNL